MVDDKKRRSCRIKGKNESPDSPRKKNVNMVSKKKINKLTDSQKKGRTSFVATLINSDADNIDTSFFFDSKGFNIVKLFNNLQVDGFYKISAMTQFTEQVYVHQLKQFKPIEKGETVDLRITALQWHPTNPYMLAIGGKGGTIQIHNLLKQCTEQVVFSGIGPGGTIEAIKWNAKNRTSCQIVTASVDGTITLSSLGERGPSREALVCAESPMREWFCAVDIHEDGKSVYGGDNLGNLAIHRRDENKNKILYKPGEMKLHTSKIKHLEFSPRDPNLMVTASLDKSVKLWDIRKLSGRKDVMQVLEQDTSVSCATFSRTDGCRLLTTDLQSELRVYKSPAWHTEHKILHPHRNFQHMTNITASWHPEVDLFVIGRYPDPKITTGDADVRSVDVFSATSGKIVHQLMDNMSLLTSLSQFNATGDLLATVQGRNFLIRSKKIINNKNPN